MVFCFRGRLLPDGCQHPPHSRVNRCPGLAHIFQVVCVGDGIDANVICWQLNCVLWFLVESDTSTTVAPHQEGTGGNKHSLWLEALPLLWGRGGCWLFWLNVTGPWKIPCAPWFDAGLLISCWLSLTVSLPTNLCYNTLNNRVEQVSEGSPHCLRRGELFSLEEIIPGLALFCCPRRGNFLPCSARKVLAASRSSGLSRIIARTTQGRRPEV